MTNPYTDGPGPNPERTEGARTEGTTALPGIPKGYDRLPTGPMDVTPTTSGPDADGRAPMEWAPREPAPVDDARLAPWALVAAIVALATSMFVGWGLPVAVIAVIAAIMSLRRPIENREVAMWALVLGICATLFSTGWLLWAATQFESMG